MDTAQRQHSHILNECTCNDCIPSATNFCKNAIIHFLNHKNGKSDESPSKWKVYPKNTYIRDFMVDYVYCFLTTKEGKHCFLVKPKYVSKELSWVDAANFIRSCPDSYKTFRNDINSYNSMLANLEATIEEQKERIKKCFDYEILRPYKTNSYVDISKLPGSEDAQKAAAEIRCLFFLELEMAMAKFISTNINAENEMQKFVLDFYDNTDPAYSIITKEDINKSYFFLYYGILNQH